MQFVEPEKDFAVTKIDGLIDKARTALANGKSKKCNKLIKKAWKAIENHCE